MDQNRIRVMYEELVEAKVGVLESKLMALKEMGPGAFCQCCARRMKKCMRLLDSTDPAYALSDEGIKLLLLLKEQRIVSFLVAYEKVGDTDLGLHMAAWELALELEIEIVKGIF